MTIRSLAASALVAAALLTTPNDASSDPDSVISWLIDEPLTMWDWGLIRLEQRAQAAADEIAGDGPTRYRATADYYFAYSELLITIKSLNYPGPYTPEDCDDIRRQVLQLMVVADPSKENYHVFPSGMIDLMFSHPGGFYKEDRPDDIGHRLAEVTYVTVALSNFIETEELDGIECAEKITNPDSVFTYTPYVYPP